MDIVKLINEQSADYLPGHLGIEITTATAELVEGKLKIEKNTCTLGDRLHGGALMAFADSLGAVGAFLNLPEGAATTTIESKTNFTGAGKIGGIVYGRSERLHAGKTLTVWQTKVEDEQGKMIGLVTQSQLVLNP